MRRLASLTLDTLPELPRTCRSCVFWELSPVAAQQASIAGDRVLEKEAWVSRTLLEWGSCGKLVYVDDVPRGYVLYAPPSYLPGSLALPTAPASADAVVLAAIRVAPAFTGHGLGRMLVQAAVRDLSARGTRAVEAFGDLQHGDPEPAELMLSRCVAPADFFLAVGFKTVAPHPRYPRLRLELYRPPLGWSEGAGEPDLLDELARSASAMLARSWRTSIEPVGTSASTG